MQKMLTETEQIRNTTEREWQYIAFYYAAEFSESVFFDIGLNEDNVLRVTYINHILKLFLIFVTLRNKPFPKK